MGRHWDTSQLQVLCNSIGNCATSLLLQAHTFSWFLVPFILFVTKAVCQKQKLVMCFLLSSSFALHSPVEIFTFADSQQKPYAQVPHRLLLRKNRACSMRQKDAGGKSKNTVPESKKESYRKSRKIRELDWGEVIEL